MKRSRILLDVFTVSSLQDVESACEKMLGVWLEGREGVRRPLTWCTLTAALRETGELPVLAANIETEINNHQ